MKNYQIFISYRRDGGDVLAGRLSDRLSALGYKVFYDVETMRSGEFNTQILNVIAECSDVLLVLPPNALDRCVDANDWVRQELAFALKNSKNIIPVIMRGFEFPDTLPEDIDKVRYMEGVTASSEYFDAVIGRIEELLASHTKVSLNYHLETKEYYKIKTPWNQPYKKAETLRRGHLKISAYLESTILENAALFQWQGTIKEMLRRREDTLLHQWYESNVENLNSLQNKARLLKTYSVEGNQDVYFYACAVLHVLGMEATVPNEYLQFRIAAAVALTCYCLDWPEERYLELVDAFREHGFSEFQKLLPLPFEAWPDVLKGMDAEFKKQFEQYAVLLFDFMLEYAMLINSAYREADHVARVRSQILSYYKWLKKNKIYLPKDIQETIYRYL